jgi:hypothetical protein
MAINVNTVYQTVLSVLNKEQRGYMTPDEFNKVATQVQLEIFENYFNTLNQQLRVGQTNVEYANRRKDVNECIAPFKKIGNPTVFLGGGVTSFTITDAGEGYNNFGTNVPTTGGTGTGLTVNTQTGQFGVLIAASVYSAGSGYVVGDIVGVDDGIGFDGELTIDSVTEATYFLPPSDLYKLGTVIYNDTVEVEQINRNELLYLKASSLTEPSTSFPLYTYDITTPGSGGNNTGLPRIYMNPDTIIDPADIVISYIRKPQDVVWGFTTGNQGQYLYSSNTSTQLELIPSEQTEVILRILAYAGIIIEDPQIVQAASQAVQIENINSKS